MDMSHIGEVLWWLHTGLLVVLVARFIWSGLVATFPAFVCLIGLLALHSFAMELLAGNVVWSLRTWLVAEPIVVIAYTLAVFELYSLALARYPGLRTTCRRVLLLAMVIASTVSVLSIFPDLQFNAAASDSQFLLVNVLRRGIYTSLLVFIVLLVSFITIFPVKLSRNSIIHIVVFSGSFLFYSVSILTMNLQGRDVIPLVNMVAALVGVMASLAWLFALNPAGEDTSTHLRPGVSGEQAALLLEKLQSINDSMGSSRKWL